MCLAVVLLCGLPSFPPSLPPSLPGNVGEGLSGEGDLLGLYISRDGGFSWSQVERGHWTFRMVALGSVIVMAPKRTTVDPLDFVTYVYTTSITHTHTLTHTHVCTGNVRIKPSVSVIV